MPSKVQAFIWTVVLNKVNSNNMLQMRIPYKALSPNICVMCIRSEETHGHLILPGPGVRGSENANLSLANKKKM